MSFCILLNVLDFAFFCFHFVPVLEILTAKMVHEVQCRQAFTSLNMEACDMYVMKSHVLEKNNPLGKQLVL